MPKPEWPSLWHSRSLSRILQKSHVQHSAIPGQVFMGKERRRNRAGVRIREQLVYKSSETMKQSH